MNNQRISPEKFSLHTVFQRLLMYSSPRMPISETVELLGDIMSQAGIARITEEDEISFGEKSTLHRSAGNNQARAFVYRVNKDNSASNNNIREALMLKLERCFTNPEKYDYVDRIAEAIHSLFDTTKIHNIPKVMEDFDTEYRGKAEDFVDYVNNISDLSLQLAWIVIAAIFPREPASKYQDIFMGRLISIMRIHRIINKPPTPVDMSNGIVFTLFMPSQPCSCYHSFSTRNDIIKEAIDVLSQNTICTLYGISGIGKTEICKDIFWQLTNHVIGDYRHIGWINYNHNIYDSIYNQVVSVSGNDKNTYINNVVKYIRSLNGDSLLIIDDASGITRDEVDFLLSLRCKLIISATHKISNTYCIEVSPLVSEECRKIYRYYSNDTESSDSIIDSIILLTGNHTLAIELLAKTQYAAGLTTSDLLAHLQDTGFSLPLISETVHMEHNNGNQDDVFIEQLSKVFNLSALLEAPEQLQTLQRFSLFQSNTPKKPLNLKKWLGLANLNMINQLVENGWLQRDVNGVRIHPLVSSIIQYNAPPSLDDIKQVTEIVAYEMKHSHNLDVNTKISLKDEGRSIGRYINALPIPIVADFFYSLSICYYQIGNFTPHANVFGYHAKELLSDALVEDDTFIKYYLHLGDIEKIANNSTLSKSYYGLAYAKATQYPHTSDLFISSFCRYTIANSSADTFKEDTGKLNELLDHAISIESRILIHITLGSLYLTYEQWDKALQLFSIAKVTIKNDCDNSNYLLTTVCLELGRLYFRAGDYHKAIFELRIAKQSALKYHIQTYHPVIEIYYYMGVSMYYEAKSTGDLAQINTALGWLIEAETILNSQFVNVSRLNFCVLSAIRNIYVFLNQSDEVNQYDNKLKMLKSAE